MIGHPKQDIAMGQHDTLTDFGATTLYDRKVARAGSTYGVPQNLISAPKSTGNVDNITRMMVQQPLAKQNTTPLKRIQSHYTFLPQTQGRS